MVLKSRSFHARVLYILSHNHMDKRYMAPNGTLKYTVNKYWANIPSSLTKASYSERELVIGTRFCYVLQHITIILKWNTHSHFFNPIFHIFYFNLQNAWNKILANFGKNISLSVILIIILIVTILVPCQALHWAICI